MEIAELYKLRNIANDLKNGIDPTSNTSFPNDTIMNLKQIRDYNKEVCEILDSLILSYQNRKSINGRKIPFFMMKKDVEGFSYSSDPISISNLCFKMNEYATEGMLKIRATQLAGGLTKLGYLKEMQTDAGKKYRVPTAKGEKLGIVGVKRTNAYGNEYYVNLYDIKAQYYVVNNYYTILSTYFMNED